MSLLRALRANPRGPIRIAFVGAGGKTTALFHLARELSATTLVTTTTHLGAWQISAADHHITPKDLSDPKNMPTDGVILVTDEFENDRTNPIDLETLNWLYEKSENSNLPLLIEADGSRQKPLKAPAAHEPPIPNFVNQVVVVAGLGALEKPLNDKYVHRAEIFSEISGLPLRQNITPESIVQALRHPQGGLKNIPTHARRVALLNQADSPALQSIGGSMARQLLSDFDSVIVGSLRQNELQTIERCAGIILAAGESKRYGINKLLLDWNGKPFVRQIAETALRANLQPILVVTGFDAAAVESALTGLPVQIIHNPEYQEGQSASIKKGVLALPQNIGAAIFLLADQPHIPAEALRALVESHARGMQPILAPLVQKNRRANPVLFDRDTFPDLLKLKGDIGGRGIFDQYRVEYIPWHDDSLLLDVDTPKDYERLKKQI